MAANTLTDVARNVGLSGMMRLAGLATRLLPIPQPTMMVGPGASERLGQAIHDFGHRKILIVTDATMVRLGLMLPLTQALTAGGTDFVVFAEICFGVEMCIHTGEFYDTKKINRMKNFIEKVNNKYFY